MCCNQLSMCTLIHDVQCISFCHLYVAVHRTSDEMKLVGLFSKRAMFVLQLLLLNINEVLLLIYWNQRKKRIKSFDEDPCITCRSPPPHSGVSYLGFFFSAAFFWSSSKSSFVSILPVVLSRYTVSACLERCFSCSHFTFIASCLCISAFQDGTCGQHDIWSLYYI